ncbi:MAG: hypothetical protein ABEL51_01625, partial [Salinibacter sp.]
EHGHHRIHSSKPLILTVPPKGDGRHDFRRWKQAYMVSEPRWLRPMSMGDVFDEAFQLYRDHFGTLFLIALVAHLIPIGVNLITSITGTPPVGQAPPPSMNGTGNIPFAQPPSAGIIANNWLLMVADSLAFYVSYAALAWAIANRYLGSPSSIGTAYGSILSRLLPYLATSLLVGLMFVGAGLLFIIPVLGWIGAPILIVILLFMTAFVNPAFVIEDRRYTEAISRSRELAQGHWGRLFILGLVGLVLLGGLPALISFTIDASPLLSDTLANLLRALLLPIMLSATVILYFDIRVREEGFDLELLVRELRQSPPSDTSERDTSRPESFGDDEGTLGS